MFFLYNAGLFGQNGPAPLGPRLPAPCVLCILCQQRKKSWHYSGKLTCGMTTCSLSDVRFTLHDCHNLSSTTIRATGNPPSWSGMRGAKEDDESLDAVAADGRTSSKLDRPVRLWSRRVFILSAMFSSCAIQDSGVPAANTNCISKFSGPRR